MKRFRALLATTWWLWLIFVGAGLALTIYVHPAGVVVFPLCLAIFLYFAYVRFDERGNRREGARSGLPR